MPPIARKVKQLSRFQRNILCMGVATRKEQYVAYKERLEIAHDQKLILHHVTGASGAPPTRPTPTPYARWNSSSGLNYGELERHLFPPAATADADDEDEDEEEYEEEGDDATEELEDEDGSGDIVQLDDYEE